MLEAFDPDSSSSDDTFTKAAGDEPGTFARLLVEPPFLRFFGGGVGAERSDFRRSKSWGVEGCERRWRWLFLVIAVRGFALDRR